MNPPPSYDYKVSVLSGGEEVPMIAQHGGQQRQEKGDEILNDPSFTSQDKTQIAQALATAVATAELEGRTPDEAQGAGVAAAIAVAQGILDQRATTVADPTEPLEIKSDNFSRMTTSLKSEIEAVSKSPVRTEFYLLNNPNSKILSMLKRRLKYVEDPKWKLKYFNNVKDYTRHRTRLWNESINAKRSAPRFPVVKIHDDCPETVTEFHRYIHVLPVETSSIILLPPLQTIGEFAKVLDRLLELNILSYSTIHGKDVFHVVKRNAVLIFMPEFYPDFSSPTPDTIKHKSLAMFTVFLDLYKNNPNQVFILCTNNRENCSIGTLLTKEFAGSGGPIGKPNLTMLEPSYIVYPYARDGLEKGLLISGSSAKENVDLPKDKGFENNNILQRNLRMNPQYGKMAGILLRPEISLIDKKVKEGNKSKIFTIRGQYQEEPPGLHLFREDVSICPDKLQSDNLDTFINTNFMLDGIHVDDPNDLDSAILILRLDSSEAPFCKSIQDFVPRHESKKFESNPGAFNGDVVQVELNGSTYSIRDPKHLEVMADWMNPRMPLLTKSEAEFLNSLNLRPHILQEIFKASWTDELSKFLQVMVNSSCLSDHDLLMNRECVSCREFLKKVKQYFIDHSVEMELVREEEESEQREKYKKFAEEIFDTEENEREQSEISQKEAMDFEMTATDKPGDNKKSKFGELEIFYSTDSNDRKTHAHALIIGVNVKTRSHKFYEIAVTDGERPRPEIIDDIQRKIEALRAKFPDYIFFY